MQPATCNLQPAQGQYIYYKDGFETACHNKMLKFVLFMLGATTMKKTHICSIITFLSIISLTPYIIDLIVEKIFHFQLLQKSDAAAIQQRKQGVRPNAKLNTFRFEFLLLKAGYKSSTIICH